MAGPGKMSLEGGAPQFFGNRMNLLAFIGFGGIAASTAVGAFLVTGRDQRGRVTILPALLILAGGAVIATIYALEMV